MLTAAVGLGVLLVAYSTATSLWLTGERWYVPRNLAVGALLVIAALASGLAPAELGLAPDPGAAAWRWSGVAVATVAAAVGLVSVGARWVPALHALLTDRRARLSSQALVWHTLVRIPLGTALFEEVAFRGVLLALLWEAAGEAVAIAGSSILFGLWHVGPTLVTLRLNEITSRRLAWVTAAVVGTSAAGGALAALRVLGGSLLAPVLGHWAVNALGLLAAAHRRGQHPESGRSGESAGPSAGGPEQVVRP